MSNWWPVHGEDEIAAVERVLRSGRTNYWQGGADGVESEGQAFEREFAAYTGARYALTCSNGTTALELAIGALRLPRGSEVLVPCRTFVATASAVVSCGHKPVLADIGEDMNVSVATLEAAWTPEVRAVVVVHYGGLPCNMDAICEWAFDRGVRVVEDCAHAHGARLGGRHVGTFGDVGCFSMCVGKIMSTGGEGGMVVTGHTHLWDRMRARRDHGRYCMVGHADPTSFKYTVDEPGTNARMTEMQAAIGRCQLKKLDGWVARRRQIAAMYDEALGDRGLRPQMADGHVFYLYTQFTQDWKQGRLLKVLNERGVPARLGGCPDIGREKAFRRWAREVPVAWLVGDTCFTLPVYPTMTDDEVMRVAETTAAVLREV